MSEEEAHETLKGIRWSETGGNPVCPQCGYEKCYALKARRGFKCASPSCSKEFTVTSGTIFAGRKLPIRDYLFAIALFVNSANGCSALRLSRELNVQYKSAFVLAHKLREVMAAQQAQLPKLRGEVEIDGGWFGGHIRPANFSENRIDRRLWRYQTGKRRAGIVLRQRVPDLVRTFVARTEPASVPQIPQFLDGEAIIYADEAPHWDALNMQFWMKRINHKEAYSDGQACTNLAESFIGRPRRAEQGVHHHIAGPYFDKYYDEMAWRENHRRKPNGEQFRKLLSGAMAHPVSRQWKGYWQRPAER